MGYIICNMKTAKEATVGETLFDATLDTNQVILFALRLKQSGRLFKRVHSETSRITFFEFIAGFIISEEKGLFIWFIRYFYFTSKIWLLKRILTL